MNSNRLRRRRAIHCLKLLLLCLMTTLHCRQLQPPPMISHVMTRRRRLRLALRLRRQRHRLGIKVMRRNGGLFCGAVERRDREATLVKIPLGTLTLRGWNGQRERINAANCRDSSGTVRTSRGGKARTFTPSLSLYLALHLLRSTAATDKEIEDRDNRLRETERMRKERSDLIAEAI